MVLPDRLRFDFNNNGPLKMEHLKEIEEICVDLINKKVNVFKKELALEDAKQIKGLRAVFGEVIIN